MLRNVTLSAEASLLRKARERAELHHTTLNAEFRVWLRRFAQQDEAPGLLDSLMQQLAYAQPGRHFSREELNER